MDTILASSNRQMFGRQRDADHHTKQVLFKWNSFVLFMYESIQMYLIYIIIFQAATC